MGFTADVRRDIRRAVRMGARPVDYLFELSTWIVLSYRVGHAIAGMPLPWRRALRLLHGPIHGVLQIAGGIELPVNAKIGGGLHLRHTNGVVVHPEAEVGMDCNLSQGVGRSASVAAASGAVCRAWEIGSTSGLARRYSGRLSSETMWRSARIPWSTATCRREQ